MLDISYVLQTPERELGRQLLPLLRCRCHFDLWSFLLWYRVPLPHMTRDWAKDSNSCANTDITSESWYMPADVEQSRDKDNTQTQYWNKKHTEIRMGELTSQIFQLDPHTNLISHTKSRRAIWALESFCIKYDSFRLGTSNLTYILSRCSNDYGRLNLRQYHFERSRWCQKLVKWRGYIYPSK